jgi:hypothetical protein
MEILQGEQFTRYIKGGVEYDNCSQIVMRVFKRDSIAPVMTFVKVADETNYPKASLIEKSDSTDYYFKIFISEEMTKSLEVGIYDIEARWTVNGDDQPIVKSAGEFLKVKKSLL